jgi:hypothetical protein
MLPWNIFLQLWKLWAARVLHRPKLSCRMPGGYGMVYSKIQFVFTNSRAIFAYFDANSRPIDTPIARLSPCQQVPAGEIRDESCQSGTHFSAPQRSAWLVSTSVTRSADTASPCWPIGFIRVWFLKGSTWLGGVLSGLLGGRKWWGGALKGCEAFWGRRKRIHSISIRCSPRKSAKSVGANVGVSAVLS